MKDDGVIDTAGREAYERHAGHEFTVSKLVTGSPSEVFDAWIRDVWLAGGKQIQEGVGRGYIGSIRRVPLGVEEEILSAGVLEEVEEEAAEDKGGRFRIPSICYRVRKPGPFPLESHLAMVCFVHAESIPDAVPDTTSKMPKTRVTWTVKTEMSSMCEWLHCSSLVRGIFRTALKSFLRSLGNKTAKQAAS